MKNKYFVSCSFGFLICCIASLFVTGCATTPKPSNAVTVSESTQKVEPKSSAVQYSPYVDWKNRGFGTEFPAWLPAALSNDFTQARTVCGDCDGFAVLVVYSKQQNLDQAYERTVSYAIDTGSLNVENITCIRSTWIHVRPENTNGKEDYFLSARIYTAKSITETEQNENILISAD